jgi:EAL domain-containing protein (putative c-di-GMP-specific phosphodiesterase class I)/GGDEF domain-containing protein
VHTPAPSRVAVCIETADVVFQQRTAVSVLQAGGRVVTRPEEALAVLVDASLPDAPERIARLCAEAPERQCLAMLDESMGVGAIAPLLNAGAAGCLLTDDPHELLREALRASGAAAPWLPRRLAIKLAAMAASVPVPAIPESSVLAAIEQRSFDMAFQPIADLRSGKVYAVDALARFHGQHGRSPQQWLDAAGVAGLRPHLERALAEEALLSLRSIPEPVLLAVKLSPESILHERFNELMAAAPLRRVLLEVIDLWGVGAYEPLAETLAPLQARGLRVAVGHSGQRLDSLQSIGALRPALLKTGKTLSRGIDRDPARQEIIHALIQVAHRFGAAIVAEGVETPRELNTMLALGATFGQGFILARPVSVEQCAFDTLPLPSDEDDAVDLPGDEVVLAAPGTTSTGLREVARNMTRALGAQLQDASIVISHLDYAMDRLGVLAAHGALVAPLPPGSTVPLGSTPEALMAAGTGPRLCHDVHTDHFYGALSDERPGLAAFASVPIELPDGARIGAITAMSAQPGAFHSRDLAVLETAALAMRDALLRETARMEDAERLQHVRRLVIEDEETGTLNAHAFRDAVDRELGVRRSGRSSWFVQAQLSDLAGLCEKHGRTVEHLLLRDLAKALRDVVDDSGAVGRLHEHVLGALLTGNDGELDADGITAAVRGRFTDLADRRGIAADVNVSAAPITGAADSRAALALAPVSAG